MTLLPEYLVALSITTTCDESHANPATVLVTRDRAEIIELAFVVVSVSAHAASGDVAETLQPQMLHWQQLFVRPVFTPFSSFCARVSGYSHDLIASAKHTLASAIAEVDLFVQTHFVSQNKSFYFVTHGHSDLRYQLTREAKEKGIVLPSYFQSYFDIASQIRLWSLHSSLSSAAKAAVSAVANVESANLPDIGAINSVAIENKVVPVADLPLPSSSNDSALSPPGTAPSAISPTLTSTTAKITPLMTSLTPTAAVITAAGSPPSLPHTYIFPNTSLVTLCSVIGIPHEGSLNCGIDNALMIAKLSIPVVVFAQKMLNEDQVEHENAQSAVVVEASSLSTIAAASVKKTTVSGQEIPFTRPTNLAKLLADFYSLESKIVFISGLSLNVNVTTIQAWLRQINLSASHLWMLKNGEGRSEGAGYIVFASHADAHLCLVNLNGRSMEGRAIQVSPMSESEFELTRPMRGPFPTLQEVINTNTPASDTKPGDWFCPTCQFHNFASRILCKNCNNPQRASTGAHNLTAMQQLQQHTTNNRHHPYKSNGGAIGGMKPGDWICTNISCRFQNYQSRMECMKCRSPRPITGAASFHVGAVASNASTHGPIPGFKSGDWVCTGCRKHNYASRVVCMQCGRPNDGTNVVSIPNGAGSWRPTDRPGDWACPSAVCKYHNYASRSECFRCGTKRL